MRRIFYIFLYLYIYIAIFTDVDAQVLKLSIVAEQAISEELKDSLKLQNTFKDYLSLKRQADTLPTLLQQLGFIESELKMLEKKNDTNYIAHYFFGQRISHVKIYYPEDKFTKRELSLISSEITDKYFVLPFQSLEHSLEKLNSAKAETGNAFAKLSLRNISKVDNNSLIAFLFLDIGEVRKVDSIAIKGYEKFPKSYIKYHAGIKKEKAFRQEKLISQNEILNNLSFASSIKAPEVLFRKDSTLVYLYLKKRNANIFDGVLGFATNEKTNNLQLSGYLNLALVNNLNFGEQLSINYKAEGDEQRDFRVKANLPYLLRTPFGLGLQLEIFKRDSTFITSNQQARITYQLNPTSSTYAGYKTYESSNLLDEVLAGSPIEDFNSRFLLAGVAYSKNQNKPLFPLQTQLNIDAEIGSREVKSSKENQWKLLGEINHIFNLNFKNSIYLQNSTSVLLSDTFLSNELFRFGGIDSMRGFDENSIDASLFTVLNTEYRYQFNQGLYIHSIIDIGYFENKVLSLKEKLYSYGIGLGLQTKPGLLKLNIANGNLENQSFKFSNSKIHIILSSRF